MKNKHKNPYLLLIVTVLLTLGISGCSSQKPQEVIAKPEVIMSLERYSREHVLTPGDQLEVAVYRNGDVSRTVTIRVDGFLSLPLLDDVKAAGLSISELDAKITKRLSDRLKDPEVTIILVNPTAPMVYVYGDVGVVKPVPLREARTLAQAIALAGGVTRAAHTGKIALVRLGGDGYLRMHVMNEKTKGQVAPYLLYQNTPLMADDLIIVPENKRSQVGRFINDFIVVPLNAVNGLLTPYFQFKLIDTL